MPVLVELHRWASFDDLDIVQVRADLQAGAQLALARVEEPPVPRFEDFLAAELTAAHLDVPAEVAIQLVNNNELIVLLDGLDELEDHHARRALRSVAIYARDDGQPQRPIAITCRSMDYARILETFPAKGTGAVRYALRIKRLSRDHVTAAIGDAETAPGRLVDAARRIPALEDMIRLPLWLSVADTVYRNTNSDPLAQLATNATEDELGSSLYPLWIETVVRTSDADLHHLMKLAELTTENHIQTLYIEDIRPGLIHYDDRRQRLAVWSASLFLALVSGLLAGLSTGLLVGLGWASGLLAGLSTGFSVGSTAWAVIGSDSVLVGDVNWRPFGALGRPRGAFGRKGLIAAGLGVGVFAVLVFVLLAGLDGLIPGVLAGLLFGLGLALMNGLIDGLNNPIAVPADRRSSSTVYGALITSARAGLTSGLFVGMIPGLGIGLFEGLVVGLVPGLVVGLGVTLLIGLVVALFTGLGPPVAHLAALIVLRRDGYLPLRLVPFLNKGCDAGILYPVGPGVRFRHRTLAEYLARRCAAEAEAAF